MNTFEYQRLIQNVKMSGDLDAARKLYVEAGRKEDWEKGMLAASFLYGAVPITPEDCRAKKGKTYQRAMSASDNMDGVFSLGRVIIQFNRHAMEIETEWLGGDESGEYPIPWITDYVPFAMLERVAEIFREVGWIIRLEKSTGAAAVIWKYPEGV